MSLAWGGWWPRSAGGAEVRRTGSSRGGAAQYPPRIPGHRVARPSGGRDVLGASTGMFPAMGLMSQPFQDVYLCWRNRSFPIVASTDDGNTYMKGVLSWVRYSIGRVAWP